MSHAVDRIEVKRDNQGEWRWVRFSGANGEVCGISHEGWHNLSDCYENITRKQKAPFTIVKHNGPEMTTYKVNDDGVLVATVES